ncbi:hypothetical protein BDD12DRAFT_833396 [Trichophaea hybrida]|nr:hypothetical protein BDD12DRAFT_833396 [Trichophaea hybrida]
MAPQRQSNKTTNSPKPGFRATLGGYFRQFGRGTKPEAPPSSHGSGPIRSKTPPAQFDTKNEFLSVEVHPRPASASGASSVSNQNSWRLRRGISPVDSVPTRAKTPQPASTDTPTGSVRSRKKSILDAATLMDETCSGEDDFQKDPWKMAWELAKKKLSPDEWPESNDLPENLYWAVFKEAEDAKDGRNARKWRYTKDNGEVVVVRKKLHKIVKALDTYAKIVDMGIQHNPQITALVWASARLILQVYLNHEENLEKLELTLETIVSAMARCEFYESIYAQSLQVNLRSPETTTALADSLESALPEFYCSVFVFSVKAKKYFAPSILERATNPLKPFSVVLQPLIDEIGEKERAVKEVANMANMEQIKAQSEVLGNLETLVQELHGQFSEAVDIVSGVNAHLIQVSDERAMNWLDATNPDALYDVNRDHRMAGTCEWILQNEEYQGWIQGTGLNYLWVVGIPGAGKSVLSANIVDELRKLEDAVVLYFFFRNGDVKTTSSLEMAASITSQLLNSTGVDRARALEVLKTTVHKGAAFSDRGRNLKGMWEVFLRMIQCHRGKIVVLLDALDECSDPTSVARHVLLPAVKEADVRFLVTGRPVVRDLFEHQPNVSTVQMNVDDDISKYIKAQVEQIPGLKRHIDEIISTVNKNSAGMFRYAALVLDELKRPSWKKISERLKIMPKGISGMYELILQRLGPRKTEEEILLFGPKDDDGEELQLCKTVLMWVAMALRPMTVAEMQYVCTTEHGTSFDPEDVVFPTEDQILKSCGSLVEIYDGGKLRFTHLTVREFLLHPPEKSTQQDDRISSCLVDPKSAHVSMALTCITQLFSKNLFTIESMENCKTSPLYYAIVHWLLHTSKVAPGKHATPYSEDLWKAVERWFWESGTANPSAAFQKWFEIFPKNENLHSMPLYMGFKTPGSDPLHIVASYGFVDIIEYAHPMGVDFNVQESDMFTPLVYAAIAGRKRVVEVLIDKGADVNRLTKHENTALIFAVDRSHEEIVEALLLVDGLDLDRVENDGDSALGLAVGKNLTKTIELLKQKGATVCKRRRKDLEVP